MRTSPRLRAMAHVLLMLLALTCVLPLVLLVMSSFATEQALMQNGYSFWPSEFGLDSYWYLWYSRSQILTAYKMTILSTLCGTLLNVSITALLAYPLSRKDLVGRNFFSFLVFFTLLFSGGMIPSYMMWTQTFHIKDTFWALILPNLLMNGFGVIVMRTYFTTNIPNEIIEAARMDGAGEMRTLTRITIPMISPQLFFTLIVMTIGSFKVFDIIIAMTQGGPGRATNVLAYFVYNKSFMDSRFGYASAAAFVMFAIIMVFTAIQFIGQKKWVNY